jgi:hypothetical protein
VLSRSTLPVAARADETAFAVLVTAEDVLRLISSIHALCRSGQRVPDGRQRGPVVDQPVGQLPGDRGELGLGRLVAPVDDEATWDPADGQLRHHLLDVAGDDDRLVDREVLPFPDDLPQDPAQLVQPALAQRRDGVLHRGHGRTVPVDDLPRLVGDEQRHGSVVERGPEDGRIGDERVSLEPVARAEQCGHVELLAWRNREATQGVAVLPSATGPAPRAEPIRSRARPGCGNPRPCCGRLGSVLATVSFYYGHRDPVSVTAG